MSMMKRDRRHIGSEKDHSSKRGKPVVNPNRIKADDHSWLLEVNREQRYADKACVYCSSERRAVKHHHFSTTQQRNFMLKHSKTGSMCPICQVVEPPVQEATTRKVIVSDSTLFGVWDQQSLPKISQHMDIECIVDGRIRHLTRAIRKNLLDSEDSLQIILVAGISNVGDGQSAQEIIDELKEMEDLVNEYEKRSSSTLKSYVSFSTLQLPPKYCSFLVPKNVPELVDWIPKHSFRNHYPIIKDVNEAIKAMNEKNGLSWLNLHLQGMKMLKTGPQHKYDTRAGTTKVWRENSVFEKLHFTMSNKLKLIQYMQNTFAANATRKDRVA